MQPLITLKILLPYKVFAEVKQVSFIVADTESGSIGILPRRLDCVASLAPGILWYETEEGDQEFVAVDRVILVKAGYEVLVSVRNAMVGTSLDKLHETVVKEFKNLDEQEQIFRSSMVNLENGFIRMFEKFRKE